MSRQHTEEWHMTQPDISNLPNCIEDARLAALDLDPGPADPLQFNVLRGRLHAAGPKLSRLYREAVVKPFIAALDNLGESSFNRNRAAGQRRPVGKLRSLRS